MAEHSRRAWQCRLSAGRPTGNSAALPVAGTAAADIGAAHTAFERSEHSARARACRPAAARGCRANGSRAHENRHNWKHSPAFPIDVPTDTVAKISTEPPGYLPACTAATHATHRAFAGCPKTPAGKV